MSARCAVASLAGVALLGAMAGVEACQGRTPRESEPPAGSQAPSLAPDVPEAAAESAARVAFGMRDGGPVDVWLTADRSEGLARDPRTGICVVLYTSADDAWHEHAKFKGEPSDEAMTPPPRGPATMQTVATKKDLEYLAEQDCK